MKIKNFLFIFCLLSLVAFESTTHAATDVEFILDASGSMVSMVDGEMMIDSARKAIMKATANIPPDAQVALRLYGHRVAQTDKANSCKDSELVVPFAPLNAAQIQSVISLAKPKGYTPLAYSLELARADFSPAREAEKVIILLTDGIETCGGDPVAVAKKMIADGFKVKIHTIGFKIDAATQKQLEDISQATGGTFSYAGNAAELSQAMQQVTQKSFVINKEKTTYGNEIRGGDNYETAVLIDKDKEYKLNHHQKKGFYDYFAIDLTAGQTVTYTVSTLEKGVSIKEDGSVVENDNAHAKMAIHGDARNEISNIWLYNPHQSQSKEYAVEKTARYYFLLGDVDYNMNKDHVTFKVSVKDLDGDAGTQHDAGSDMNTALLITAQRYPNNFLGKGTVDALDVYSFTAKKDEKYFVGLIPNGDVSTYLQVKVTDDYKQKLSSKSAGSSGAGVKTDPFVIPADGTYFIFVETMMSPSEKFSYALDLKIVP